MEKVDIYTGPGCGFCVAAKRLLDAKNLPYVEHDVSKPEAMQAMRDRLPRAKTIPQIFFGPEYVGGYEDLRQRLLGGWPASQHLYTFAPRRAEFE